MLISVWKYYFNRIIGIVRIVKKIRQLSLGVKSERNQNLKKKQKTDYRQHEDSDK